MARCEVCGNEYKKTFRIIMSGGDEHIFDSFECAVHALAPTCEHCGCKVIGHGIERANEIYCCRSCADMSGRRAAHSHGQAASPH